MTPAELLQIKQLIRDAIADAAQPLRDDLDVLRATDKTYARRLDTHSGAHREIVANVRKSLSDVTETTNADLLAATTHLADRIESVTSEVGKVRAENKFLSGQVAALQNVPQQTTAATSAAIDTRQAVAKGQHDSRNRTIATIISMIIIAVLTHLAKS